MVDGLVRGRSPAWLGPLGVFLLASAWMVCVRASPACQDEAARGVIVDPTRILYGDPDASFERPAVVNPADVIAKTSAYRRIVQDRIPPRDPRHARLMAEARKAMRAAIARVASAAGYDLVGEQGAIIVRGRVVPDITQEVIRSL